MILAIPLKTNIDLPGNTVWIDPISGDEPLENLGQEDSRLGGDLIQEGQTPHQSLLPSLNFTISF